MSGAKTKCHKTMVDEYTMKVVGLAHSALVQQIHQEGERERDQIKYITNYPWGKEQCTVQASGGRAKTSDPCPPTYIISPGRILYRINFTIKVSRAVRALGARCARTSH